MESETLRTGQSKSLSEALQCSNEPLSFAYIFGRRSAGTASRYSPQSFSSLDLWTGQLWLQNVMSQRVPTAMIPLYQVQKQAKPISSGNTDSFWGGGEGNIWEGADDFSVLLAKSYFLTRMVFTWVGSFWITHQAVHLWIMLFFCVY